jgi:hypothetical protein
MTIEYTYLVVFVFLSYLILTDASVPKFIELLLQFIRIQYLRAKWWIQYSPDNPVARYLMWRRSWKLAKEMQEEFSKKNPSNK